MILAACSPASEGGAPDSAPTTPPAADSFIVETVRATAGDITVPQIEPLLAGLESGTRPNTPSPDESAQMLAGTDWLAVFDGGRIAEAVHRAVSRALAGPGSATSGLGSTVVGASSPGSAFHAPLVRPAPFGDSAHAETETDGIRTTGDVDRSIDGETARETTTATVDMTGQDSETGDDVSIHIEGTSTRDLCWGEDGSRTSSSATTATGTRQTADGPVESTVTRTTRVTVRPDGAAAASLSVNEGGYTATINVDTDNRPGRESLDVTTEGDHWTATFTFEDGTLIIEGDGDFDADDYKAIREAADEMSASSGETMEEELKKLQKPGDDSAPGGNEYCIHLTLSPETAQLGPNGETVTISATVTDWADRPLVAAVLTVDGARLGSVAPKVGSTGGTGEWQTVYTSGDSGVDRLTFTASRFNFAVERQATITISSGQAIHWSDSKFGQTATFDAQSCDGTTWSGSFTFSGSPGGAELSMSTELGFEMVDGHAETDIVNSGTIGAGGEDLSIQMPYSVTIDIDDETGIAHVVMTRQSNVVTVEGFTISAAAFPEFSFETPLSAAECE